MFNFIIIIKSVIKIQLPYNRIINKYCIFFWVQKSHYYFFISDESDLLKYLPQRTLSTFFIKVKYQS